ncbi:hypothetical protein SUDANB121_03783 [Nocardiopsis dassonvillei]
MEAFTARGGVSAGGTPVRGGPARTGVLHSSPPKAGLLTGAPRTAATGPRPAPTAVDGLPPPRSDAVDTAAARTTGRRTGAGPLTGEEDQ